MAFNQWKKQLKELVNRKYGFNDLDYLRDNATTVARSITIMYENNFDGRKIKAVNNDYEKLRHIIDNLVQLQELYNNPLTDNDELNFRLKLTTTEQPRPPPPLYNYVVSAEIFVMFVNASEDATNPTYKKWNIIRKTGDGEGAIFTVYFTFSSPLPEIRTPTNYNDPMAQYILDAIKNYAPELRILNENSRYKIYLIKYRTPRDSDRFSLLTVGRAEDVNDLHLYKSVRLHGQYIAYEGIREYDTDKECMAVLLEYSGLNSWGIDLSNGISLEELEQFIHYTQTPAIILNLFDEPIIKFKKGDKVNTDFSKIAPLIKNYKVKSRPKMMIAKVANGHLYNITDEKVRHKYQHPEYKKPPTQDNRPVRELDSCGDDICDCTAYLNLSKMKGVYSTRCTLKPLYDKCLNSNYIPKVYENKNTIVQITVNGITIYHDRKRKESKQLLELYNDIYGCNEVFINQSFLTVLKLFLPRFQSITNEQTAPIFENNISCGGFYFQEEHKNLFGLDINSAYPTIMKNNVLPVFTGTETIRPFTGTIEERSLYYINPKCNNLMCQKGYFYGCAVNQFIKSGFLEISEILDEVVPNSSTNEICGLMATFEEKIKDVRLLKEVRCNMSGLLGQLDTHIKVARTTSLYDVHSLKNTTYKVDGCINNLEIRLTDPTGFITTLVNYQIPVYKVVREDKEYKLQGSRPAYTYIIHKNYANLLVLRRWILSIPTAEIVGVKTDAIYFRQQQQEIEIGSVNIYQPSETIVPIDQPAKVLKEDTFKYIGTPQGCKWVNGTTAIRSKAEHHYQEYKRIIPNKPDTIQIDNTKPIDLTKYTKGFHIDSMPGTGKTHLLKQLQKIYKEAKTITFTNAVAHNIGGETLHKFFNQKIDVIDYNKAFKIPSIVLIDECYNIPAEFYPLIAKMRARGTIIYSFGDSEQLESIDKKRMTQDEKKLFWSRMSSVNLVLLHNWRSNNEYVELAKTGQINPPETKEFKLINICKYNSSREQINTTMFQRFGYMRFVVTRNNKKEDMFKGQIYELKDNQMTLLYRGPANPRPFKTCYTKSIEPGYAITNHIAQGSSINESYNIVDFDKMDQRARFVALTRTTNPDLITQMPTLPRDKRQPKRIWKDNQYI